MQTVQQEQQKDKEIDGWGEKGLVTPDPLYQGFISLPN
jgi:hypothetical protein